MPLLVHKGGWAKHEAEAMCGEDEDTDGVSSWTLTLIEREDDTRSWGNFLVYFSHNVMPT
jgi:hypothetical protein